MLYERILKLPKKRNYFLFGARQTGKTTLLNHVYSDEPAKVYNLLLSDTFRRLSSRPELFRAEVIDAVEKSGIRTVIVDEVQKIPELLDEIHAMIEMKIACNFVLSGSSARKLKRAHANMLAGRAWTCKLYPLSILEIPRIDSLQTVLQFGLLPSVYPEADINAKKETLRSYVETYIEQEVRIEAQLRNIGSFLRFLPIAATENASLVNFSNIARESEVKSRTIKGYYEILEDTLLGFFLHPLNRSVRKKMARHPKFYFIDTGIVNALSNKISGDFDEMSRDFGNAFESLLICEIRKINEYFRKDWQLSFYRTESGVEVDCVIVKPDSKIIAIEIKTTKSPLSSHCRGLRSFAEVIKGAKLILACRAPESFTIGDVNVINWQNMLQMLASDEI